MRHVPPARRSTRRRSPRALYEPADVEPDLVLVLGPPTRLPPSLVWELAYGELVFVPVAVRRAAARRTCMAAIDEFHGRRAAGLTERARHELTAWHWRT